MGAPVVFLDPRSKGAQAYKAFAWEFQAKNPTRLAAVKPAEKTDEAQRNSPGAQGGADAPANA